MSRRVTVVLWENELGEVAAGLRAAAASTGLVKRRLWSDLAERFEGAERRVANLDWSPRSVSDSESG